LVDSEALALGAAEPLVQAWVRRDVFGEDFDGDRAVEACVEGLVRS
jgi:hypothetical protein